MTAMIAIGEALLVIGVVSIPFLFVLCVIAMCRGSRAKRTGRSDAEETQLIQELHQSLNRLERRIDSIETIVLENERMKDRV